MTNEDLKRFYKDYDKQSAKDFVRYTDNGTIQAKSPIDNHDVATKVYVDNAVAGGGGNVNVHTFDTLAETTPLITTDDGIEISYDNDGKILIPIEGTDDVVVDIDETNKKINIHLDATVRAKLARMLLTPVNPPVVQSYVMIGTNGAQTLKQMATIYNLGTQVYTTQSGDTLPTMSKTDADAIYSAFIDGTMTLLKWIDTDMTWHLTVTNVSENDGQKTIVLTCKNYVMNYTWAEDMNLSVIALPWR